MEGILLIWIIFASLLISTVWLIKQLDAAGSAAKDDTTQETATAIAAEIVALVPVAMTKQSKQKRGRRMPRPPTPNACAMCRQEAVDPDNDDEAIAEADRIRRVIPSPLLKSKRGRPKTSNTEGYARLNPTCDYRRITDSKIHALVGDGSQKSI